MNITNILNSKELQDIPILYILRIINEIQKENIKDGKSGSTCEELSKNNE